MSKTDIWFPFYVADYLADTGHLARDEHGGYVLLMMAAWKRQGILPNDDVQLARLAKATRAEWRRLRPVLAPFFEIDEQGWRQGRLAAEYEKAAGISAVRRVAGKLGGDRSAEVRWGFEAAETTVDEQNGEQMLKQTPKQNVTQSHAPPPIELTPFSGKAPEKGSRRAARSDVLPCPFDQIVNIYHEAMPDNPRVVVLTGQRKTSIKARWNHWAKKRDKYGVPPSVEGGLAFWRRYFEYAAKSPFLTGRTARPDQKPFLADIDFLFRESKHVSLIEGKYHSDREAA